MNAKFLFPLIACIGLAACSSDSKNASVDLTLHYITTTSAPQQTIDRYAQSALTEAAVTANHSLERLSSLELAKNPHVVLPKLPNPVTIGLDQHTSIDWNGPAEPLLQKLAASGNYTLHVLGRKPITPILVNMHVNDQALATIIRSVQYQIVAKASVRIFPKQKVIELLYFPT